MKLSVIVPGYNVEEYIAKCIESIVENEIPDMEVILINDGSKDNTIKIMKKYAKKYPKLIKLIDQENKGLSMARNAGIEASTGKYITFVDSDDAIQPNMYKTMLEKAEEGNFDVVACGVNVIYPDKTIKLTAGFNHDIRDKEEIKSIMNTWYTVVWNKVYKRSILKDVRFKKGVWYEDVEFLYRLLPNIKSIGLVNEYFNDYMQRPGSITYTYNSKLYHLIENFDGVIDYYKKKKLYKDYKEELEFGYVRYLYATFVKRLAKMKDKEEFKKGVDKVISLVNEKFPEYRKNKYLKPFNPKNLYLKCFNKHIAKLIFITEKNKMN